MFLDCLFGHEPSVRERDDQDQWIDVCPRCRKQVGRPMRSEMVKTGPAREAKKVLGQPVTAVKYPDRKDNVVTGEFQR